MTAFPALAQDQTAPPVAAPQPPPQAQKTATEIELTASSSTSEAGSPVTFTAIVTGKGGTPTGTVTFKDGKRTLDTVELSDGQARFTTSALAIGQHAITAAYRGEATFEGSVSATLTNVVAKASTSTRLVAPATTSEAGRSVSFMAEVTSAAGSPTGAVIFKDGDRTLGEATLTDGRASFRTPTLPAGQYTITAAYRGDGVFGPSTSEPQTYRIRQSVSPPENMPAVLIPILLFLLLALLVLCRRLASRWLFRPLRRWLKAPSRVYRWVLRFGRRAPARERPFKSFVTQGVGGIAFAETDDAFADFDKSSIQINRHFRLGCSWIEPAFAGQRSGPDYDEDSEETKPESEKAKEALQKARADFQKTRELFGTSVPLESNPLNLYDDIHNAFIVNMLGRSDKACLYVLSEFGKVISANVLCLAVVFSSVVTLIAVVNIVASDWVPFWVAFDRYVRPVRISLPFVGEFSPFRGIGPDLSTEFDKAVFASLSCLTGYFFLLWFYQLAYEQLQRLNGQQLNNFLFSYLADLRQQFTDINNNATKAVVGEKEEEELTQETVMWITNLQWIAWRVFFIEEFLRNVWFQIRRDRVYSLALVPLVFLLVIIVGVLIAANLAPRMLQLEYHQYSFYLLFPILLYWCYRCLRRSLTPVSHSLRRQWAKFRNLDVVHELTDIMAAYVSQLHQWKTRFRQGPSTQ